MTRPRTHEFTCFVEASPALVWAALTGTRERADFLHGLVVESTWQTDAPIRFRPDRSIPCGDLRLTGRVLRVEPLRLLSYTVQAGPDDPAVYLTWEIRPHLGSSVVRLHVDEVECADTVEEAENTWLPVLGALQATLARQRVTSPGEHGPG
jgi:uncharacterized protein YndB with AHSA1/START domain